MPILWPWNSCSDDILPWGKDGKELDMVIQELRDQDLSLTEEMDNDTFAFLCVTMKDNGNGPKKIRLKRYWKRPR
jgi:hypothetical protein